LNKAVITGGKQFLGGNPGQLGELQKGLGLLGTSNVVLEALLPRALTANPA
jgi:hypothetical protein